MNNREDMIRYGDLLEQRLIQQHRLNKIEVFYIFNGQEGDIDDRLNEVLDLRDEAAAKVEGDEEDNFHWLTEEDELIAQYGLSNFDFVRNQEWTDDSLEHYLGKPEQIGTPTKEQVAQIQQMRDKNEPSVRIIKAIEAVDPTYDNLKTSIYGWLKKHL